MDAMQLGLLVRSAPWQERSGREALDVALAAATLDWSLELYFLGAGVLQLLADRELQGSGLPPGLRAWASVPDFAPARFFVAQGAFDAAGGEQVNWVVDVEPTAPRRMVERQSACDRLLVL